MKTSILLLALLLSASWASAQRLRGPLEQPPLNPFPAIRHDLDAAKAQSEKGVPPVYKPQSVDPARLKQDADELASLAQSIPPAVDQTTKGILPGDLDQKLKRIEKLAKQLRSRISH
jgi:hypothetical protein